MTRRYIPTYTVAILLMVGGLVFPGGLSVAFGQVRLQRLLERQLLMVVDVNDKSVGQVIATGGSDGEPVVYFTINGQAVTLGVEARTMHNPHDGDALYFASTNCTGQGFLGIEDLEQLQSPVAVLAPGNTVYLPVPGSRAQSVTARSTLSRSYNRPGVNGCDRLDFPEEGVRIPAQAVVNLNTFFTPPFRLLVTTQP